VGIPLEWGGRAGVRNVKAAKLVATACCDRFVPSIVCEMPVSMSHQGYRSPSQRMSEDEARLRARKAKVGLNPGPGAYDPRRMNKTAEELAGSTAFKSRSDRKTDGSLREVGDPGAYHPYDNMGVSAQSSRSFNRQQSTGTGGFGSKTRRAELSVPNEAPGPGTYDAKLPSSPEARQGSAFASQSKRGTYLPRSQTPGAGEYSPGTGNMDRRTGGDSMFRSREDRFKQSMELEYSAHVGPGSYSQGHGTVAARSRRNAGRPSSSFGSTSLRGDLFMGGP
jgi:hypothetical protein